MATDTQIVFIGGDNMARSFENKLLGKGFNAMHIHVADPNAGQLQHRLKRSKVHIHADNLRAVSHVQAAVPAVKSQMFRDAVHHSTAMLVKHWSVIISSADGVQENAIHCRFDYDAGFSQETS